MESQSGWASQGLFIWYGLMAHYSPELIEKTISLFESRTGRANSQEEARQSLENISGFFQVLQEWDGIKGGSERESQMFKTEIEQRFCGL